MLKSHPCGLDALAAPATRVVEVEDMRCWACNQAIAVTDMANRLPPGGAIVHRECYTEATGHQPPLRLTLADTLRLETDAA